MLSGSGAASNDVTIAAKNDSIGLAASKPGSRATAVFVCGALAFLNLYCTQPLLPLLARVFGASETSVSGTISASTLGVAISSALLAIFAERVNRKRMIVSAMVALAIVSLFTATAPTLRALSIWRFLQGLLTPGVFIITIAYVTEEWPALLVPRVMSIYVAGTVFGGFVGRISGGLIAGRFGWRMVFIVLCIAGLAGAGWTAQLLPPATPKSPAQVGVSRLTPLLANMRNSRLLATLLIGFCMLFTLVSVFSYITFYLAEAPFHLSTAALSWLFAVYVFGLLATLAAGTVLTRIGLRYGMMGAVALCLGGVMLTLVPSLPVVGVGLALASSGVFIAQTCANSFLRDAAPMGARVSAAGMYICSYYIGGTVGGILPGLLWKQAGWPGCVALIGCFLVIAGATAFFGWRAKDGRRDPVPV